MRLHKAPKGPRVGTWLTATDMSGSGTSVSGSANMDHDIEALGLITNPSIVVEYECRRTAGSGGVHPWVRIWHNQAHASVSQNADAGQFNTARLYNGDTTLRTHRVVVALPVLNGLRTSGGQFLRVSVEAAGSEADTEWEVVNIRSALIYTPL